MKKTVLTFGLISGVILVILAMATLPLAERVGFDKAEYIGYTNMILSFTLIFFGVRSYRENVLDGYITFWRALKVGLLIFLISSCCYVLAWEIVYFGGFFEGHLDKFTAYYLDTLRQSGSTPEQVAAEAEKMKEFMKWYNNPLVNILVTFMEPLRPGVLIALLSAAILRKKRKVEPQIAQITQAT